MRWIRLNPAWRPRCIAFAACALVLGVTSLFSTRLFSAPAESGDHITVYGTRQNFTLKVLPQQDREYVDLITALAQFGTVASNHEGAKLKLRFGSVSAQFEDGKRDAKIGRNAVILPDAFQLSENSGLLTIRSLTDVLPHFLNEKSDYHEASRRLFIGNSGIRFNAELKKSPSALIFTFTNRVSPQISVEGGKMRLLFSRDGVSMSAESWRFNDPLITSAAYEEKSTGPELIVSGSEPLLATFGDGGRTISIAAAPKMASAPIASAPPSASPQPQPPAAQPSPAAAAPLSPEATAAPATPSAGAANPAPTQTRVYVLVDAGHGGDEPGATFSENLVEKDVTLAIARRLRNELENRGISCALIRDSDITLSLDQRAVVANSARPALYLSIHAGALGSGLRIYNATLAPTSIGRNSFQPWETAQAGYVTASRAFASSLLDSMGKSAFPVALMPAPLRPLNNIAAPALAVEVAPRNGDLASLGNANYQQEVATRLAAAIASARPHSEQAYAGAQP